MRYILPHLSCGCFSIPFFFFSSADPPLGASSRPPMLRSDAQHPAVFFLPSVWAALLAQHTDGSSIIPNSTVFTASGSLQRFLSPNRPLRGYDFISQWDRLHQAAWPFHPRDLLYIESSVTSDSVFSPFFTMPLL